MSASNNYFLSQINTDSGCVFRCRVSIRKTRGGQAWFSSEGKSGVQWRDCV